MLVIVMYNDLDIGTLFLIANYLCNNSWSKVVWHYAISIWN